ncbi:hypothetical protein HUO14_14460 [Parasphingorhabdus flavimaris]|jgi:hypothetical protein|uniref:Secreted protein n=1 Tax=Parasphingorhabdus flavimaris TaxID=266812 RepID=A0ABX2N5W6_9SPHN|nr:hypothetical protein [Parasphingorhabdus flavimaris]NVD29100.1 hypothetical protein [Parasphingorhabdus flavimaris]|tara:strand:- start:5152 stop:5775 length:624 start_codon:yes stop_codon:yes gene_type:complete
MIQKLLFSAAILSGAGMMAAPAMAQDQPGDRVNQLVVYGDDPCPQSSEEEIVVCARKDEGERYRIPETLRSGSLGDAKNQAWSERVKSYEYVGASGTSSCSPTGAGGFTGCTQQLLRQAYAEKGIDDTVNWGQLIEEERQKRLSRIDAESDAVEERLLEIEAQREARNAAAEAARERLEEKDAAALEGTNDLAVPPGAEEVPGPDDE